MTQWMVDRSGYEEVGEWQVAYQRLLMTLVEISHGLINDLRGGARTDAHEYWWQMDPSLVTYPLSIHGDRGIPGGSSPSAFSIVLQHPRACYQWCQPVGCWWCPGEHYAWVPTTIGLTEGKARPSSSVSMVGFSKKVVPGGHLRRVPAVLL